MPRDIKLANRMFSGFRLDRMKYNAKRPSSSDLYIFSEMRGKRRATAPKQATTSTKQSKKVAFPAKESSPAQNLIKEQIRQQPVLYRYGIFTWR